MKNIYKSLLALNLVFSLGLSAAEESTMGMPVQKVSKTKQAAVLSASVLVNAVAVCGMVIVGQYISDNAYQGYSRDPRFAQYLRSFFVLASKIGMVELSNHIITKLGLKTNKLCLYGFTFGSGIPHMIQRDVTK